MRAARPVRLRTGRTGDRPLPSLRGEQLRCPACGRGTTPASGRWRPHTDLAGDPCLAFIGQLVDEVPTGIPTPDVVIPLGTYLSPTGACHGCGTTVSGERRYCGLCVADPTRRRNP